MKLTLVALAVVGLVCRAPAEAPLAQARPTEQMSPVAVAMLATSAPATAVAPTAATAPAPPAPSVEGPSTSPPGTLAAALAPPSRSLAAPPGGTANGPAERQVPPRLVTASDEYTAVLLAPVVGSPAAGQVPAGTTLTVDAAVFGEVIDGSPDWYFVVGAGESTLRGFVHASQVQASD
jgi:hypothetical protein